MSGTPTGTPPRPPKSNVEGTPVSAATLSQRTGVPASLSPDSGLTFGYTSDSGSGADSGSAAPAPPPITVPNINAHKEDILNLFFDAAGSIKLFKIIYDPVLEPGVDEVNDEKYEEENAMSGGMKRGPSSILRPDLAPPAPALREAAAAAPQPADVERTRRRTAVGNPMELATARRALLDGIVAPPQGAMRGVEGGINAAFAEVTAKIDFRSRGRSLGSRKAPRTASRSRPRARSAPAGTEATIRDAYATSSTAYSDYIDAGKRAILAGGPGNVVETVQQVLSIKKFPAFLGLERSKWEKPNAGTQCTRVPDPMRNKGKCWLCGNPVPIAGAALPGAPDGTPVSVCGPDNNFECEHVLPAPFMFFTKTLINDLIIPEPEAGVKRLLYDSSCKLCNGIKDNGLYLKASWEGDRLKFEPNNENIIVDILVFLVSTRITKGREVFTGPLDSRLPPWPGIPTTYGELNPQIALPPAPDVNWPASALDPSWRRSGPPNDPCETPWIYNPIRDAPPCGGEDDEPSESDDDEAPAPAVAVAAAAAPPLNRGPAVHFFSLKRVSVPVRPGCDEKYVKLSVSQQHFTSIATVGERKFHNLARAAAEYASDGVVDRGVAPSLDMDYLSWLVGKNVGVLDLLPISPEWELNLGREAAILVSVNNEGSLRAAMKSLQAARIPQDVNRNKAWNWIRGRFEEIHRRMVEVCQYFNSPPKNTEISGSVRSLVTTPVLTAENFIALNKLPNLPPLPRAGGRRLRFTIHRRSESRQTKKNRRRRVIEVSV
jgi:hypothetical protein